MTGARCLSEEDALRYVGRSAKTSADAGIQAHVDECAACRILLGEAARAMVDPDAAVHAVVRSPAAELPRTLSVGEVIMGRFEIVRFVARGGMGEVYQAHDVVLRETVALKTLVSTALDDEKAMTRLIAEVRLARQVTHPNVCRILEFGFHTSKGGDTLPFLTMEFLHGETLAKRIAREGKLSPTYVGKLLAQIVAGLDAIHGAGIVHRDIKPQNMVLLPGPPERLVLMDFGLARTLSATTQPSLHGPVLAGTLDYMAPEQLEGQQATASVDIYALGVVLFEMLTGKKPFKGPSTIALAIERLEKPPPRPSEIVPHLDPVWDARIRGCLARDPSNRFSNVDEVLDSPTRR